MYLKYVKRREFFVHCRQLVDKVEFLAIIKDFY